MASENGHPSTRRAMFNQDAVSGSGSGQPKGSAYVKTRHQALPRQGYRPQILRPASSAPAHHTVSNGSKLEDRLAGNVRDRSVKEVSLGKGKRSQTRRKSKKRYKSSKQKIIVSVLLMLVLVVGSVYAV